MKLRNIWVLIGAACVLAGFCLGWVGLRGLGGGMFVNGWQVLSFAKERGVVGWSLYLLPVGALAAGLAAWIDRRVAATIAMVVGAGLLCWGGFELLRMLYHTTFAGLWTTVFGALVLLVAGVETRERAR
ncbi:MAG: hypothetical protein JRI23_32165 [Deltaproteobacteria bacterium]|jgi:hypothetical protein|nr:hypothetical protein [Deltaproteobacteria bacterium]MBW2536889.1 hypothetical protein [Deltaproteobacteria bacterium]